MPTNIPVRRQRGAWPFKRSVNTHATPPDTPLVSVIIPSYNQGDYLEAAIRSVLCQDYPAVECLVLDAGSQDDSAQIIEHYQDALSYSRSHRDNGQSAAVNEGARHAKGKYMSFLNSDDMLAPGTISHVMNCFARNPDAMLVYGQRILIDTDDRVSGWSSAKPFDHHTCRFTINSETAFWKREVFEELGGFNESLRFALDLDFFCRIYKRHPILQVNKFLGLYRFHHQSKSETLQDVCAIETSECWKRIFNSPWQPPAPAPMSMRKRLNHWRMAVRNPQLVLMPYLQHKLGRLAKPQ
ncbi:glycosyltransferase family 2 protein [Cerasicoccus frondis]|uniref:glycosyltransferase family 2 protein n=1 Tax=Cerasicoccus frondis TaxID=490090 RepID=UPI002852D98C|nr:glycosyltransferase family 2 protein [Cerasicoccus frondis]